MKLQDSRSEALLTKKKNYYRGKEKHVGWAKVNSNKYQQKVQLTVVIGRKTNTLTTAPNDEGKLTSYTAPNGK